ncbi:MAG: hypothetical protein QOH21_2579, partial [Acidobacteriota bacterium]|nr:hypothetical protein [Acidobacteriota bacterium]
RAWIRLNLKAHYQQAELLRVRAERTSAIWGELEEMVKAKGLPERAIYALFDATVGFRVRNGTYRKAADVSDQIASRDLKAMVGTGLLIATGEARGRSYSRGKSLFDLWSKSREAFPFIAVDPFIDGSS